VGGTEAQQGAQGLADLAKVHGWVEVLHESKHVALGGAQGIPPSAPVVADDDDLAFASTVFKRAAGAAVAVQRPWGVCVFEDRGAVDGSQLIAFLVGGAHGA